MGNEGEGKDGSWQEESKLITLTELLYSDRLQHTQEQQNSGRKQSEYFSSQSEEPVKQPAACGNYAHYNNIYNIKHFTHCTAHSKTNGLLYQDSYLIKVFLSLQFHDKNNFLSFICWRSYDSLFIPTIKGKTTLNLYNFTLDAVVQSAENYVFEFRCSSVSLLHIIVHYSNQESVSTLPVRSLIQKWTHFGLMELKLHLLAH